MKKTNEREIEVLLEIQQSKIPIGAGYLSSQLNIPLGSMGKILQELEKSGLIQKESNKGRILSSKGADFLNNYMLHKEKIKSAETLIDLTTNFSKQRLIEIVEVRTLLECKALEYACRNITEDQLKEVEEILLDNTYEVKKGLVAETTDLKLHLTLAKYSGNATIYQILKLILTQDNCFSRLSDVRGSETDFLIQQHQLIVQMVKERKPEKACEAMQRHMNQLIKEIKEYSN